MILSLAQIEEIAAAALKDFWGNTDGSISATPIDQFARDYLNLEVSFAELSEDGSVCGVTAYTDTKLKYTLKGIERVLPIKQNQVILDSSFVQPGQVQKLCGKRRFTLAHECAHQILFAMEPENIKASFRKRYRETRTYSLRELKNREDWNEWQANALAAAILMPPETVGLILYRLQCHSKLINYDGWFSYSDKMTLTMFCRWLGVSKSAAVIRIRQLGLLEDKPYSEYVDPLEVWA